MKNERLKKAVEDELRNIRADRLSLPLETDEDYARYFAELVTKTDIGGSGNAVTYTIEGPYFVADYTVLDQLSNCKRQGGDEFRFVPDGIFDFKTSVYANEIKLLEDISFFLNEFTKEIVSAERQKEAKEENFSRK